ncbi:MFS transporter [Aeromicrobium sp. CnD17-E]|uniref:MFS transporter n=1 Tax=Aeromicrobium sp. CnD17-E TaxID=2954487 RepID=UPI0020972222|nr:MFS transporter [Aeromicrobium sp. CnD17-E]MCO7239965.1 MFS transporter [Aeromicrobium sp. CnD17-E]
MASPNRWLMLAVGMLAQVSGTVAANAAVALIPFLTRDRGLTLGHAGALASASLLGTTVSLVGWGVVVDRWGERLTLTLGLVVTTVGSAAAAFADGYLPLAACWFVAGVGVASSNAASGRLVVGWFPPERRGTAMGIRQAALPLGVGLAAVLVPTLVEATDLRTTLLTIAAINAATLVACAVLVVDPPRRARAEALRDGETASPYAGDASLLRIHAASALLVVPQFTVWTFMLTWLIAERGWSAPAAGALVAVTQLLGSAGRVGVGWWSDRVGSRMGPMRVVALAAALAMLALGLLEPTPLAVVLVVVASVVTVADNGLAFTAVAERAGPWWSGKALGVQNTGQYLVSAAVPPVVGVLIAGAGYGWAFGLVAVLPLLALPLVPTERRQPDRASEVRPPPLVE